MKKQLLLLFAFLCSMGMWADTYKLVESVPSDWSGNYLLVAVNNSKYYVWDGTFGTWGTCVEPGTDEISSDKKTITPSASSKMAPMTIEAVTGGYALKSGTSYLASTDKKFNASTTAVAFSYFALANDGKVIIKEKNDGANDYGVRYNYNSGSGGFRVYKNHNTADGFYLYKSQSGSKTSTSLSFATGSPFTVNIGESFTAPTLTATPSSILSSVSFSSNNTSVAEVNSTSGAVTIKGLGTATIKATYAGDNTYSSSNASYVINVVDPNIINATFDLSGNQYGWDATNNGNVYYDGATYDPATEGYITLSVAGNVRMWGTTESSLRLYKNDVGTDPNIYSYGVGSITLKAAEGYVITGITFEGSNLTFVPNVGTYASSAWTGTADEVTLEKGSNTPQIKKIIVAYRATKSFDLNIPAGGWASMAVDFNAEVPGGASAYYASAKDINGTEGTITLKRIKAGEVIPAGEGVVVKGTGKVTFVESNEAPVEITNIFSATATETATVEANAAWVLNAASSTPDAPYFSVFTGTTIPVNKAYIAPETAAGAKTLSFSIDDNTVTSISAVENTNNSGVAYNLAGQRVAANAKGIVIINGKKFINK